jgi:hypothetical protein
VRKFVVKVTSRDNFVVPVHDEAASQRCGMRKPRGDQGVPSRSFESQAASGHRDLTFVLWGPREGLCAMNKMADTIFLFETEAPYINRAPLQFDLSFLVDDWRPGARRSAENRNY